MAAESPDEARLASIDRAFAELLDLTAAHREARLRELESEDPALEREVRALLHHAQQPDPRLDGPHLIGGLWAEAAARLAGIGDPAPGELVGGYRLVRRIGRGGMATVWLAERADRPFTQRAALKLLFATGEPDALQRFARERDILAGLEHPAIARLLDAGVAEGDRPWIAMEYVEGDPIDVYCDEHRLPVEARAALVEEAAGAVSHAHRCLVVHRDLKPSNIFVTRDGRVKLLDFGIARLIDEAGGPGTAGPPTLVMTPDYASPEQMRGAPVTTASDVYQLGAILFELLAGCRPHETAGVALTELTRLVCESDVTAPSASVFARHADAAARSAVAAARGTTPRTLVDALRGDLDHIALRALDKRSSERYLSARALAEDLRRYRSGLPVEARRGSSAYRVLKFVRRHRTAVAAAAILAVGVVGYAITSGLQARRLAIEVERTHRIKAFLASLLAVANPAVSRGERLTAVDLVDLGAARVEGELADDPRTRAELQSTLGTVYSTLGQYGKAAPLLASALATMQASSTVDEQWAQTALSLGRTLHYASRFGEAERCLRDALRRARARWGERHYWPAELSRELGSLLQTAGALDEAERLLEHVVEVRTALGQDQLDDLATPLRNLADVLVDRGEYERAERLYRESSRLALLRLGPGDPILAMSQDALGRLLVISGRYEEAEKVLAESLARRRALYRDDHPALGLSLHHLGQLRLAQGRLDEAEPALIEARRLYVASMGDTSHIVSGPETDLCRVALGRAQVGLALSLCERAVTRFDQAGLSAHPALPGALSAYAAALDAEGASGPAAAARARAAEIAARHGR